MQQHHSHQSGASVPSGTMARGDVPNTKHCQTATRLLNVTTDAEVDTSDTTGRRNNLCRELCTSCRSRIDAIVAEQLLIPGGGKAKSPKTSEVLEFRLFQTSMPDYAVAIMRQKLTEPALLAIKSEAELGQEISHFLETRFGGTWNVIVGEDFAASVIYGANSFMHCAVGGMSYLVFSWQPVTLFESWTGASLDRPY